MDLNSLKTEENHWNLSEQKKALLVERVYQRDTGPRTIHLSILKPILVTAAVALILLGGLLLWGQRPIEEQIVTIPGASSEAKPGEYIENQDPAKEEVSPTPPKEEGAEKPPAAEEKLPAAGGEEKEEKPSEKEQEEEKIHRFWETEKEMPYEEAVAIVKEKLENRPFEPLTDKERMAYYQCISATVYAEYLSNFDFFQKYGNSIDPKELTYSHITTDPIFLLQILTTNEAVGVDIWNEYPLIFEKKEYKPLEIVIPEEIQAVSKDSYIKRAYTSVLKSEAGTVGVVEDYYLNEQNLEYGTGYGNILFSIDGKDFYKEKASKEVFQEIIRHYLSIDSVTWINVNYAYDFAAKTD